MGKFISLKRDYSFKEIFRNEIIRKYFISDVLEIPLEEIRSVRLHNTFLWTRHKMQKQGILDVMMVLNDNSKMNIELQIRAEADWDKRSLFYLSKMFVADLRRGEKYHKLQKCIEISILGFNLDDAPEYHKIYRLRDKAGRDFSDMFEVHIIELKKELYGLDRTDDWIRLFRAESKEELNMLMHRTKNPGILEAIKEINIMNLSDWLKAQYEFDVREERDKAALEEQIRRDASAQGLAEGKAQGLAEGRAEGLAEGLAEGRVEGRVEGRAEGLAEGLAEGRAEGLVEGRAEGLQQGLELKLIKQVQTKLKKGMQAEQIASELEEPLENVERICKAVDICRPDAAP